MGIGTEGLIVAEEIYKKFNTMIEMQAALLDKIDKLIETMSNKPKQKPKVGTKNKKKKAVTK